MKCYEMLRNEVGPRSTSGKRREEVRSWPAYVATLLRRFDPDMTINLERKPKALKDHFKRA